MQNSTGSNSAEIVRQQGALACSIGCDFMWWEIGTKRPTHLASLVVTKDDVDDFIAHRPEYKKVNRFKEMIVEIYF